MSKTAKVDVLAVLDDLHRGCRAYADSDGSAKRTNYADDLLERRSPEARASVAELIEHNRIMREALTKLARAPGCGCSPICRCGEGDWTRYELEGRMDYASEALAKATGETP